MSYYKRIRIPTGVPQCTVAVLTQHTILHNSAHLLKSCSSLSQASISQCWHTSGVTATSTSVNSEHLDTKRVHTHNTKNQIIITNNDEKLYGQWLLDQHTGQPLAIPQQRVI